MNIVDIVKENFADGSEWVNQKKTDRELINFNL